MLDRSTSSDKSQSPSPPGWGLSMRPTTSFHKKNNVTETETRNSTSRCPAAVKQGTASMTSDSERLQEAVTVRSSALAAQTKTEIGFWNVRTMYDTGKTVQVTNEIRGNGIHIIGINECRWTGTGDHKTQTGETILFSGRNDGQHHGVQP